MPDGSVSTGSGWRNPRPLPVGSLSLARKFWADKPTNLPPKPIEHERGGMVICVESAPGSPQFHNGGATVADTVSQWTLMVSALYRLIEGVDAMTILPKDEIHDPDPPPEGMDARLMAAGLEAYGFAIHDADMPLAKKEQRRKRNRSRIVRDGNAPILDPATFPVAHGWAVDWVNRIANKRFSPPDVIATNAKGQSVTTWLTNPDRLIRRLDLLIFRRIARRGGGHGRNRKYGPKRFVRLLLRLAVKRPYLRDAPTPLVMGESFLASQTSEEHETTY